MAEEFNREKLYDQTITIYTEANPNPNSMKFMLSFMLIKNGDTFDFPDLESAKISPLATALFEKFDFIERIFYMSNFITLTKKDEISWTEVIPALKEYLTTYFREKNPVFDESKEVAEEDGTHDSEAIRMIKSVLEEYIKPAVEMDGGAIQFHSFDEKSGVVKVLLQGSCSGCPSSTITLKAGIENMLKRMIPTVKEVVAEGV